MYWIFISYPWCTYRTTVYEDVHHTYKTSGKKKTQLVHSLAQALTLTLTITLNHLANKPQWMASTLFALMYIFNPRQHNRYFNKCARMDTYEYSIRWRTATWIAVNLASTNFDNMQIIFKEITESSGHAFRWERIVLGSMEAVVGRWSGSLAKYQSRKRYLLRHAKVPYVT